ncbi:MAG: hypothetical protein WBM04_18285, partial [Candidatus Korobacteraceae bacterium]
RPDPARNLGFPPIWQQRAGMQKKRNAGNAALKNRSTDNGRVAELTTDNRQLRTKNVPFESI